MQVRIESPSPIEVQSIHIKDQGLEIVPLSVRGQHLLRVGYLSAKGENGGESKAILYFNGNTGEFVVSHVSPSGKALSFDTMKPADFEKQRQEAIAKKKKSADRLNGGADGADDTGDSSVPPPVVPPTASEG